ncbi:MAG: ABC transporter ATP-binding protein [Bdellovibrionales bacterium]
MLEATNLSKQFKLYNKEPGLKATLKTFFHRDYYFNEAVKNFNLSLPDSGLVGLIGPNGSGKTTLMKMFTGIITPSAGSVKVIGEIPSERKNKFKKNISLVMGQKSQLWWDIPVMDSLLLFQKYYEIEESVFKKRVQDLGERLETTKFFNIPVRKLSLGERMKMELMACLLHEPKVIFLDEPTIGLDSNSQKNVRQFLQEYYRDKQPLILLTSHYMADVEALCKKIVLIVKGEKKFDGSMEEFKKNFKKEKTLIFDFLTKPSLLESTKKELKDFPHQWNESKTQLKIRVPEKQLKEITIKILTHYSVSDFQTEKVSIEDIMDQAIQSR